MTAPDWLVGRAIAHRGLHDPSQGVFENTLAAADAAIAGGFAIECDVQDTADADAVVFHDFTLERLTSEAGPVRERSSAQLARIAIGETADRIPSLKSFLDRISGRAPLIVEIKSRFDGDLTLTHRTVEIVSQYRGPVALKSFDPIVVAALRTTAPEIPRGIVAESRYDHPTWDALTQERKLELANLLHFGASEPDFLSWRVADLPCAAPFLCRHLRRIPVMAWTVRTSEDAKRAARYADQMVFEGFVPAARPDDVPADARAEA
jgi:glycerophosphoryl diester phosphodiesterase